MISKMNSSSPRAGVTRARVARLKPRACAAGQRAAAPRRNPPWRTWRAWRNFKGSSLTSMISKVNSSSPRAGVTRARVARLKPRACAAGQRAAAPRRNPPWRTWRAWRNFKGSSLTSMISKVNSSSPRAGVTRARVARLKPRACAAGQRAAAPRRNPPRRTWRAWRSFMGSSMTSMISKVNSSSPRAGVTRARVARLKPRACAAGQRAAAPRRNPPRRTWRAWRSFMGSSMTSMISKVNSSSPRAGVTRARVARLKPRARAAGQRAAAPRRNPPWRTWRAWRSFKGSSLTSMISKVNSSSPRACVARARVARLKPRACAAGQRAAAPRRNPPRRTWRAWRNFMGSSMTSMISKVNSSSPRACVARARVARLKPRARAAGQRAAAPRRNPPWRTWRAWRNFMGSSMTSMISKVNSSSPRAGVTRARVARLKPRACAAGQRAAAPRRNPPWRTWRAWRNFKGSSMTSMISKVNSSSPQEATRV